MKRGVVKVIDEVKNKLLCPRSRDDEEKRFKEVSDKEMKRLSILLIIVLVCTVVMPTVAYAAKPASEEHTHNIVKSDHKIKNKWDLSGSFVAKDGYNWGGLAEGATWTYSIHIKEAMNGEASVGSIGFTTGDIEVVGHVKATQRDYSYGPWSALNNLAAVGTAVYNDTTYYFMFLYAEEALWFALSETPYDSYWATGNTVWDQALRAYQLHSKSDETFLFDYKAIH